MQLALSDFDRGVCKIMFDSCPWSGGEDGMTMRLSLENAIKISELGKGRPADFPIDKLPKQAAKYSLPRDQIELLVSIVAGGGGAPTSQIGRVAAELIGRIRKQCPKKSAGDGG